MSEVEKSATRVYYDTVYTDEHPWAYGNFNEVSERDSYQIDTTRAWLKRIAIPQNALVLEIGCGHGALRGVHPGWCGIEFSTSACRNIMKLSRCRLINADAQCLPIADASVDVIFSWAALEHIPRPELVFSEVERILKPGGFALLAPAWNCRSWTVKRLPFRRYSELPWTARIEKATIPIRNLLLWRSIAALPGRLRREITLAGRRRVNLEYRQLEPDMDPTLPHISDDDAFASIDPHAAISYFQSRKWTVASHPSLPLRMLARNGPVVVIKPAKPISAHV